jgi:hypothetical protein
MAGRAYEFSCEKSLYQMEDLLTKQGPWAWRIRDCAWYPDYLMCRPDENVRICIYEVNPPGGLSYRCMIDAVRPSELQGSSIETVLLQILESLPAINRVEILCGEWPFD